MKKQTMILPLIVFMLAGCGGEVSSTPSIVGKPGTYRYEFEECDLDSYIEPLKIQSSDKASGTSCIGAFNNDTVISFKFTASYAESGATMTLVASSSDVMTENGVNVGTKAIESKDLNDVCYINGTAVNNWMGTINGSGKGDIFGSSLYYDLYSFSLISTKIDIKQGENIIEFKNCSLNVNWDYLQIATSFSELKKTNDGATQIEFDVNGPDVTYDAKYINKGELMSEPTKPTFSYTSKDNDEYNFVFEGWFLGNKKWNFQTDKVSKHMVLKARWRLEDSFYNIKENTSVRKEGTTARVMSFNVLTELYNASAPTNSYRTNLAFNTVKRYLPDVVAFQEFDSKWYDFAKTNLTGYKLINDDNRKVDGRTTYTTIAYNTNSVKLIKYDQVRLTPEDNWNCRNVVTGLFEFITGENIGKQFVFVSTHWNLEENPRILQAADMARILDAWEEEYPDLPVITCGDFNSYDSYESSKTYVSLTGYVDSKKAKEHGIICSTSHGWIGINNTYSFGPSNIMNNEAIDHIYVSDNAEILYYDTVVDKEALSASDHCPIYSDLKF